jgi:hypothetical protein
MNSMYAEIYYINVMHAKPDNKGTVRFMRETKANQSIQREGRVADPRRPVND